VDVKGARAGSAVDCDSVIPLLDFAVLRGHELGYRLALLLANKSVPDLSALSRFRSHRTTPIMPTALPSLAVTSRVPEGLLKRPFRAVGWPVAARTQHR
jgi:hypothetical protein